MAETYAAPYVDTSVIDAIASGTQGKTQKRQSRRLSKPRTKSSSRSARPRLSLGNLDALTKSAANSVADLLSPSSEKRALQQATLSDQGPKDATGAAQDEEVLRTGNNDGAAELGKAGRLQRTGTRLARHLGAATRPAFTKSTSNLALDQITEQGETYEWLKEKAQRDRQAMQDHGLLSEDTADTPMPYRRKSMLTPGLATRGGDVLRKPVDVQARYYNPHLSPISPLARIASLDTPGRIASALDSTRASTPAERDNGRILGALRIANGRAYSPSLSHVARPDSYPSRRRGTAAAADSPLRASVAEYTLVLADSGDGDTETDALEIAHPAAYDPYAEDAGNPWADKAEIAEDITAALARASQPTDEVFAEQLVTFPSTTDASAESEQGGDEEEEEALSDDDDHIRYPPLEAPPRQQPPQQTDEQHDTYSAPESVTEELPPSDGRRSVLMTTTRINAEEAMLFEDEPPIIQPPRLRPPTPTHRPTTGEATLRDSRLEMARILDHMMAASRYTPVQRTEEDWPSSAASDMPSLGWSGSGSSSHTSLASAAAGRGGGGGGGGVSPTASMSYRTYQPRNSRVSPDRSPADVIPEDEQAPYQPTDLPQAKLAFTPNRQLPQLPAPASETMPQSPDVVLSTKQDSSPLTDSPPVAMSASAKQSKPAAKKLQKRPPRPRSMPPVPVNRIVVSGHRNTDRTSSIPEVPEDMRARVAERWSSRPFEDREPTIPTIEYGDEASSPDYFASQPTHSRNHSAPQLSPGAPPIPEKSAARRLPNAQADWQPANPAVATPDQHEVYMQIPQIASPGAASSAYSQSQFPSQPGSRPQTAASRPPTSDAYATTDDDAPIDWSRARRVWAARRQDAGQSLQRQIERAREQIEANGSLFNNSRAPPAQVAHQTSPRSCEQTLAVPEYAGSSRLSAVDKRSSLQFHLPLNRNQNVSSPLSQPSAAPSPLKQATAVSSPSASSWVSSGRHRKNVRSAPDGSYFPASASVASGGTGFEGDVDTDQEYERMRDSNTAAQSALGAGRYEGGLQFAYEKGKGIGGSAGTRSVAGQKASRKTGAGNLAEGFGVDLSDVPIFVTRGSGV